MRKTDVKKPLRLLIIEDSEKDTELLISVLLTGGFEPIYKGKDGVSGITNISNYDRHFDVPFLAEHICKKEIVDRVVTKFKEGNVAEAFASMIKGKEEHWEAQVVLDV